MGVYDGAAARVVRDLRSLGRRHATHSFVSATMKLVGRPLLSDVIGRLFRAAIVNIRFWYFTDIDALGQNAIGAMDPSRVPNALIGHHWTFLLTVAVTAAALPYASQKYAYGYSVLKPIDTTFLLISLFLSTVTAAVRQAYIWKTKALERDHARLLRRYKHLERRFNVWPLPATRQVSTLLQNFETHKVLETPPKTRRLDLNPIRSWL